MIAPPVMRGFSDWPLATFPAIIPEGFADSSWHNDACPCLIDERRALVIYCDHPNQALRDYGADCPRYSLQTYEPEAAALIDSDDWNAILAALAALDN